MKTKIKDSKEKKIALLITIAMLFSVLVFLFYRHFHDQEYREQRCAEDSALKTKQYYETTGRNAEDVVIEMFHEDCMRDAGWLK